MIPVADVDEEVSVALGNLTERINRMATRQDTHEQEIQREQERLRRVERNIEALKAQTGVYDIPRRRYRESTVYEQSESG